MSLCSDLSALSSSIASLKSALGTHATNPSPHLHYLMDGLAVGCNPVNDTVEPTEDSNNGYCGGVPLPILISTASKTLNAKTRLEKDMELTSSQLFLSFLNTVKSKGYFDGAGEEGDAEYEQRYRKIVEKFRAKVSLNC